MHGCLPPPSPAPRSSGSTAELLCNASAGDPVSVSPVMGKGFALDRLPASTTRAVLLFATGSGISPLRAVIDSGALAGRDVTLYYGTRNPGEGTEQGWGRDMQGWIGALPAAAPVTLPLYTPVLWPPSPALLHPLGIPY